MAGLSQSGVPGRVTSRHGLDRLPARGLRALAMLAAGLAIACAHAAAPGVSLRLVASGFSEPLLATHAGDRSGRIFVVEKGGRIRIVRDGVVNATPFLDLSERISTSGERGLLGLAFHPQYAANGQLFVFYARRADGALVVSRFRAAASGADVADASSEIVQLVVPHPDADNHNGGHLAFGPDGYLYVATGDGGGGGDPNANAQNLQVNLGKLLRLDVSAAATAIPPSNPFANSLVWAYGLRNPWRFSFDRATGDLYIADVGQNRFEEVDFQPAGAAGGRNYGWRTFEGTSCFNPPSNCALDNHTPPVLTYGHELGESITGGYVYRGMRSRALQGWYLYGDFGSNRIWAARRENGVWINEQVVAPGSPLAGISSFGEDEAGEIHVVSYGNGRLYALDGPATVRPDAGAVTGLYWNPAESGWGVQFTQRGDSIFATIYHYDANGNAKWYVASNCLRVADPAPLRCRGNIEEATGPRFFGVPFDVSAVRVTTAGAIDLTFHDASHATMSFNIGAVARAIELQRQVFRHPPPTPEFDMTDLYNNASEPGWGLSVSHQGDIMFITWYVYDDLGRPAWLVAPNCAVNSEGGSCSGPLYRVTGPPFGPSFDPARVTTEAVGQLALAWLGPDFVSVQWTIGGVPGSKGLARQRF